MACENLAQILIDAEVVTDFSGLRELLASGQVKQGNRVPSMRSERIDTKNGLINVGTATTIYDWLDHSLS